MSSYDVVRETAKQYELWNSKDTIVLAVSGGIDSMVLLYMMHECAKEEELNLVVAHVNHGYRPEESRQEKQLVENTAQKLEIPFEYIELEMPQYLLTHPGNPQALGRERRYQFLYAVAAQYGASVVATAHHADDQVETVLQHFIRGSGISGLSGIPIKRVDKKVQLIRPLLRINKDSIIDYQRRFQIPYLEDSSNLKKDYTRNQLRLEVVPYLEEFNVNFKQAIVRLSELATDENEYLEQIAIEQFEKIAIKEGSSIKIERNALSCLHVALQRRLIKLILNYLSFNMGNLSYESIERVRASVIHGSTTSRFNVNDNVWCILEYDYMRFIKEEDYERLADVNKQINIPYESTQLSFGQWDISVDISHQQPIVKDRFTAVFDADQLCFPLIIRTKQAGDRIHVQGLSGSKKLQDLFVDAKIPSIHRLQYPIICDHEQRLVWVPGVRRSNTALVLDTTKTFVVIHAQQR